MSNLSNFKKLKTMVCNGFENEDSMVDITLIQDMISEIETKQAMYEILIETQELYDPRTA